MIGSGIAVLTAGIRGHGMTCGLRVGEVPDWLTRELTRSQKPLQRLTTNLGWIPSIEEIHTPGGGSGSLDDPQAVRALLERVQHALEEEVLATAITPTPERLRQALLKNPREALFEVRSVHRTVELSGSELVPIFFEEVDQLYVGWQSRDALSTALDCEYRPHDALYLPFEARSPRSEEKEPSPHETLFAEDIRAKDFAELESQEWKNPLENPVFRSARWFLWVMIFGCFGAGLFLLGSRSEMLFTLGLLLWGLTVVSALTLMLMLAWGKWLRNRRARLR